MFDSIGGYLFAQGNGLNVRSPDKNGRLFLQQERELLAFNNPFFNTAVKKTSFGKKRYIGKSISLNFQNIQVRSVLQLLAEFTGMDLVVSDKVTGNITLRLNDIPWDQALDIILTTRALGKRIVGKVMLIAPVEEINEHEKKELQAEIDLINLGPIRSDLLQINYAKAADIAAVLQDKNIALLSARGGLTVDTRTNTIWIRDNQAQIEEIKRVVRQLDIPVKQVLIEARIVNVTKDFAQELGLHFSALKPACLKNRTGCTEQLLKNAVSGDKIGFAERLNLDLAVMPITASPASIGIALAKLDNGVLLDLELSALESEGRGEIISSPRLLTTDQQAAFIESGEEVPYQEATSSGGTTVAFKKAVLSLKVTPQITPASKILMDLQINQNTLSTKVFNGVPAILTKEVHTNVLVNNGQTIVLGGIYKRDKNNIINRVPFLGRLPLIGVLFKNQSAMIKNEELLIFITPRIISNNLAITADKERLHRFVARIGSDKFGKRVGTIP
ncbi:type IV pilus secretin PilQ [Legionella tunisiensis]|uniref:type IV pilus secretin PilQ n=1 Tax=Legionella tunisiensis TaxID=1034944 RepID=UPI00035FF058|nr:type IV pilus secretin PilQ [Legionella tunisiensis]